MNITAEGNFMLNGHKVPVYASPDLSQNLPIYPPNRQMYGWSYDPVCISFHDIYPR